MCYQSLTNSSTSQCNSLLVFGTIGDFGETQKPGKIYLMHDIEFLLFEIDKEKTHCGLKLRKEGVGGGHDAGWSREVSAIVQCMGV